MKFVRHVRKKVLIERRQKVGFCLLTTLVSTISKQNDTNAVVDHTLGFESEREKTKWSSFHPFPVY